jgi:hypothetical protein
VTCGRGCASLPVLVCCAVSCAELSAKWCNACKASVLIPPGLALLRTALPCLVWWCRSNGGDGGGARHAEHHPGQGATGLESDPMTHAARP